MSLVELTRNSFQSGVSAQKWLSLCKLLIPKLPAVHATAENLSNTVLVLYRSYPGDPHLQEYLKSAIRDGILPLSTFVTTLLQAARSPELHQPVTLDTLVRIALDAHYSSGKQPLGSVVATGESLESILAKLTDAIELVRKAAELTSTHFHTLVTPASELLALILSCISDLSALTTAQALFHFTDVNSLITTCHYRLPDDVRQALDSYMVSLTLLLGDDVKAAREAQMMQTMQFALGRGSIFGPNSSSDLVSLGLLLNYIVTYRGNEYGAGDGFHASALLAAAFRSSSWTPMVFYTQVFLSAFSCLAQNQGHAKLWRAFVIGRLPVLLQTISEYIGADSSSAADSKDALVGGITTACRRSDLLVQVDHAISREAAADISDEDASRSFLRDFLQHIVKCNIISVQIAASLDPSVALDNTSKWFSEAQELGLEFSTYLENKFSQETNVAESIIWLERVWRDVGMHAIFANIVLKRFSSHGPALECESFGYWCKLLCGYEPALDMIALHIKITDLTFYALQFMDEYTFETAGDTQSAVGHVGDVALFIQYTFARYKFPPRPMSKGGKTISPDYLVRADGRSAPSDTEDATAYATWRKALFDHKGEGIEDAILRSTKPKTLLRISPTLIPQAIARMYPVAAGVPPLDKDVFDNGVSYFTGPLLNWTLVGVIKALVYQIMERFAYANPPVIASTYDVLQSLILSPSCPKTVLAICSPQIASLFLETGRPASPKFNFNAVRQAVTNAVGASPFKGSATPNDPQTSANILIGQRWHQQVHQAVQTTFSMARSHKAPYLDLKRCVGILPPISFLHLLWNQLLSAANMGEVETCRRVVTFVLTTPLDSSEIPLLPIFMHVVLPPLIVAADKKPPPEQTLHVELLTVVISSILNATLNFEWAVRTVAGDDRLVLGQSSAAMARRLASELRRNRGSDASSMILQRLASSQPFVANFPAFIGDAPS